eukprot:c11435_g1_i1.p1 GENE.c11435_g1_i1~~c11435_g1_i1.p1  ORF type:complete len:118 (-),score=20.00 c11435_g1_i1:225-578(-)
MKQRLQFARKYQNWTIADWKQVIFSDESKICRINSGGRVGVWGRPEAGLSAQNTSPTLKFGGGQIMVWGCMTWSGVGEFCRIFTTMDAEVYVSILQDELMTTIKAKKTQKRHLLVPT